MKQPPEAITCLFASGRSAVLHAAALLGVVTHAANNHKVSTQRLDGSWESRTLRDAQVPERRPLKRAREVKPPQAPIPMSQDVIMKYGTNDEACIHLPNKR